VLEQSGWFHLGDGYAFAVLEKCWVVVNLATDFTLASLVEDQEVLELAREAAQKVIAKDATLRVGGCCRRSYRYERLMGGAILT